MRVINAFTVLIAMVLVSCAQSVAGDRSTDSVAKRIAAPGGDRSIWLTGDSRVYLMPEGFLSNDWHFIYNQGVPGFTSEATRDVIAAQQIYFHTAVISVGINDCNPEEDANDILNDITKCILLAKERAEHVYITTIPGVRESPYFSKDRASLVSIQAEMLNVFIPIIAQNLGVEVIYLDELLCDGIYLKKEYDDGSGIHYNEAAYAEIEQLYSSALSKYR